MNRFRVPRERRRGNQLAPSSISNGMHVHVPTIAGHCARKELVVSNERRSVRMNYDGPKTLICSCFNCSIWLVNELHSRLEKKLLWKKLKRKKATTTARTSATGERNAFFDTRISCCVNTTIEAFYKTIRQIDTQVYGTAFHQHHTEIESLTKIYR